jgi:nicotinamidase-related amidase
MFLQIVRAKRRQVLVDIDTQRDFLLAEGKACIRNHRRVLAHIRRVMAWARSKDVPIISTCEVCPANPPVADIDGTEGQQKVSYTLVSNRISFPADGSTDLPRDMLRRYKQVILHKRCIDPFDEPRIDRLLSELQAAEFILIGVTAEAAVRATALGLIQRDRKVIVVVDAVGTHDNHEARMALRKVQAKGARLIETRRLAGISHLRKVGACHCESCRRITQKLPAGSPRDN